MESFFALLQRNAVSRRCRWRTRDKPGIEIVTWIERTYLDAAKRRSAE